MKPNKAPGDKNSDQIKIVSKKDLKISASTLALIKQAQAKNSQKVQKSPLKLQQRIVKEDEMSLKNLGSSSVTSMHSSSKHS